jgi:1,4-alpha-glucan branching enzyme
MLKKTPVRKSDKTSVVFEMQGFESASQVNLVGEFNNWEPTRTPMKRRKDGAWSVAMRLANDARYEYKIVVDGKSWIADENSDELSQNPFGGQNSVVVLN